MGGTLNQVSWILFISQIDIHIVDILQGPYIPYSHL